MSAILPTCILKTITELINHFRGKHIIVNGPLKTDHGNWAIFLEDNLRECIARYNFSLWFWFITNAVSLIFESITVSRYAIKMDMTK